jgi:hypothetical protein
MSTAKRWMRPFLLAAWIGVGLSLAGVLGCLAIEAGAAGQAEGQTSATVDSTKPQTGAVPVNPLDAERAYGYLKEICAIGPRKSGSEGMKKQQALVQAHFEKLGGKVSYQHFLANNPLGGEKVRMANMIVEWHPERKERILLAAHYDTRPLPDNDLDPTKRRNGLFIGANDGGSGVALLMELAHLMPKLDTNMGVDFALLDGEELVYVERRDPYCLGSQWFAKQYAEKPPQHKYRWGIVLDMVGDADLHIYQEKLSVTWRDTRPLVNEIWATAGKLGVKEFIPRIGYEVNDDHVPLRGTGRIPTCDIIDFIYPAWHTTDDTPQRCAGSSLAKVGWVVYEWLKGQQGSAPPAAGN